MNVLYQILYPGAYLPLCIMALYHLFRYHIFNFYCVISVVVFAAAKITHMEHLDKSVIQWNLLHRMSELCFVLKLILFNKTSSTLLAFIFSIIPMFILYKRLENPNKTSTIDSRIYCILLVFLSSVALNRLQFICSIVLICITLYEYNTDMTYDSMDTMKNKLISHFNIRIATTYLLFILDWSSSKLHWASLLVILSISIAFQLYAWTSIDTSNSSLDDYYYTMCKFPKDYPIPLDFTHARDHCKIAKKLFKPHQI